MCGDPGLDAACGAARPGLARRRGARDAGGAEGPRLSGPVARTGLPPGPGRPGPGPARRGRRWPPAGTVPAETLTLETSEAPAHPMTPAAAVPAARAAPGPPPARLGPASAAPSPPPHRDAAR